MIQASTLGDETRQEAIERLRDELKGSVAVAIEGAKEIGKAITNSSMSNEDFEELSRRAATAEALCIHTLEDTFRVIGQALHDAEAEVPNV